MQGTLFVSDEIEASYGAELQKLAPRLSRFVSVPDGPEPDYDAIEVVYFSGDVFPDRARDFAIAALKAENLRWMHTFSAGVDDPFFQTLLDRGVKLTTSSGAHAVPIAQTVMLYLLALSRDLPGWLDDQANRRWNARPIRDLQGLRLGVLGMGPIGLAVAELGLAFGMEVSALRRSPRGDEPCPTGSMDALADWLPEQDAVVLAVPLNDDTRGLIDREAIARLRPGALLVNVARGDVVDEVALIDALSSGHLGGAGLDVFAEEPLPEESPLWSLPNVIVTPHSSGTNPGNNARSTAIFLENLSQYLKGAALRNEVVRPGA